MDTNLWCASISFQNDWQYVGDFTVSISFLLAYIKRNFAWLNIFILIKHVYYISNFINPGVWKLFIDTYPSFNSCGASVSVVGSLQEKTSKLLIF